MSLAIPLLRNYFVGSLEYLGKKFTGTEKVALALIPNTGASTGFIVFKVNNP